jgi:hypothetical protein
MVGVLNPEAPATETITHGTDYFGTLLYPEAGYTLVMFKPTLVTLLFVMFAIAP